jgi:hypothetical protein
MKERPILFTPDNALKTHTQLKSQTRRVAGFPSWVTEIEHVGQWWHGKGNHPSHDCEEPKCGHSYGASMFTIQCPFGVVGDRLWVREAWRTWEEPKHCVDGILYKGDGSFRPIEPTREAADKWIVAHDNGRYGDKWRHARFMFRWCSRTLLDITDIRVERLQDISEEDAVAEGVTATPYSAQDIADIQISDCAPEIKQLAAILGPGQFTAKANYMMLWDSINAKTHPWSSNPWVFAITFRRI